MTNLLIGYHQHSTMSILTLNILCKKLKKNTQNTIKINSDGEVKYFENKNTEQPIFHSKI